MSDLAYNLYFFLVNHTDQDQGNNSQIEEFWNTTDICTDPGNNCGLLCCIGITQHNIPVAFNYFFRDLGIAYTLTLYQTINF